jgi:predicted HTH transcriptional regulator
MLKSRKVFARDYRNRRIGDFLKELDLSEGRGTGFPIIYSQMEENGSPAPIFETDEKFTHFLTVLPVNQSVASLIKEEELYNQGKEDAQKVVTEEESEEKTTEKGVEKGKENTTENGKRKTTEKTTEKSVEKTTENGVEISKENTTENGKRKTTEKIIHLMKENPKISQEAIAEILGITSDGVFWNIKQLKVRGIIQRIGADRGGYWKVIKK